jgi:tripartite-type tricarboxylate transporter receptor subunit TctC
LPDLPAISEAGVQGFDITISFGLYAPKGTPKPVMDQLTTALQKSVADPEVRQRLEAMGVSAVPPDMARPEALRAHLKYEMDSLNSLLTKAGVKAN